MIFLYSRDQLLVEFCTNLEAGPSGMTQIHHPGQLKREVITPDDLLVIDLKDCRIKDLPVITIPAIALAEVPDFEQARRLLRRGVRGYGNRYMQRENLVQAVTSVRAGQVWMPPAIIGRVIASFSATGATREGPSPLDPLSKREAEVARLVARGLSNKELAENLHISVRTVKAHLTSIFSKTGFRDRLELAIRLKND